MNPLGSLFAAGIGSFFALTLRTLIWIVSVAVSIVYVALCFVVGLLLGVFQGACETLARHQAARRKVEVA